MNADEQTPVISTTLEGEPYVVNLNARTNALKWITSGDYVIVVGPHGCQKSQLLHDIRLQLITHPGAFLCSPVDLGLLQDLPDGEVLQGFCDAALCDALATIDFPLKDFRNESDVVRALRAYCRTASKDLVLVLDHLERVRTSGLRSILRVLRAAFNERGPDDGARVCGVAASSLSVAGLSLGPQSPFNIAQTVMISDLSRSEAEALIGALARASDAEIDPDAVDLLLEQSGGDRSLIPVLFYRSLDVAQTTQAICARDVASAVEAFVESSPVGSFAPLAESIRLVTQDPSALAGVVELLERRQGLPVAELTTMSVDSVAFWLTGVVKYANDGSSVDIRSEVYKRVLDDYFGRQRLVGALQAHAHVSAKERSRYEALHDLAARIRHDGIATVDSVFDQAHRAVLRASPALGTNLLLLEDADCPALAVERPPTHSLSIGLGDDYATMIRPRKDGLTRRTLDARRPLVVESPSDKPGLNPLALERGVRASVCLPLATSEGQVGTLFVHYSRNRDFRDEDEVLALSLIANEVSLGIESARRRAVEETMRGMAWIGLEYSNMAHEITQRVSAILSAVEEARTADPALRVAELLGDIEKYAGAIDQVPRTALRPAGATDHAEPYALGPFVGEHVRLWCRDDHGVELTFDELGESAPLVRANKESLAFAIKALVTNAVAAALRIDPPGAIGVSVSIQGQRAITRIANSGPPIPAEYLPLLFLSPVPKPEGEPGVGLGLMIARAYVLRLGGDLQLERTDQDSTVFRFWLPIAEG